jgi:hypothetical protein
MLLAARNAQPDMQLIEKQSAPWLVRLKPLPVNHQLRNGPLAHVPKYLCGSRRIGIDIDLGVDDPVSVKKLLGGTAIPAPFSRINQHMHTLILASPARQPP